MAKIVKAADKGIAGFEKIFIDDPRRAIVIGVFIVAVIVLLVVFWDKLVAWVRSIRNRRADKDALETYQAQTGEMLTLSNATYQSIANKIYGCCKGLGTDEDGIYKEFSKLNNTADMLKLVQVFGVEHDGHDLDWWMRSELNRWELKKLNSILSAKGIDYAF